jgi:hypothetical protein
LEVAEAAQLLHARRQVANHALAQLGEVRFLLAAVRDRERPG